MEIKDWVGWFRHASPYINAHRGQTVVIGLSGAALQHENLENIIHDLALLNSLGVRLVVVFGARPQIDASLVRHGVKAEFHKGLRVTSEAVLPLVLEAYGRLRSELEAKLSMGIVNSPMHGAGIRVVSGNFVMARPIGVLDGVDHGNTGYVRRIETDTIKKHGETNSLVLIPAIGYSVTGDVFNLNYEDTAAEIAIQLGAEKLVFLGLKGGLTSTSSSQKIHQLTVQEVENLVAQTGSFDDEIVHLLQASARSCQFGVKRAHLLNYVDDGALLSELYTRDGSGTMISIDQFDQIRAARLEDINGIQELIHPLEEQGFLVRRSRERLETELDYFLVDARDNAIIGCAGLYPFPSAQAGELSCFAVDGAYRREGRGDRLLAAVVERARSLNFTRLFVLTTKTEQWFRERGFTLATEQSLPGEKEYNRARNAKVLVKHL